MATITSGREFPSGPALAPLADSVRRLAAERPHEPAVCFRDGWDWRWWTWAQLAEAASERRADGSSAGYPDPEAVAALVAADRVPVDDSRLRGHGRLVAEPPPLSSPGRWRRALGVPAREVVVEVFPTSAPLRIEWLRWAFERGAALVAAPSQANWLEVVLFARPTLLWGGAAEASSLLERARGRRRPFDRLRAFAWTDSAEPPSALAPRFAALAIALLSPPLQPNAVAGGVLSTR